MKRFRYVLYLLAALAVFWLVLSVSRSFGRDAGGDKPAATLEAGIKNKVPPAVLDAGIGTVELSAAANVLSQRNIILFIDESGSMKQKDCPGDVSRWDWCAQQSGELARILAPLAKDNLTIVPFASTYSIHEHCTPKMVAEIFNSEQPKGHTDLLTPLAIQLAHHIASKGERRPVVMAIISDGRPAKEEEVADAIIHATKQLRVPSEVSIVFLQVGKAFNGKRFLQDVDEHLVARGAKYDIVSVRTFDTLQQLGLAKSLADAIKEIEKSRQR